MDFKVNSKMIGACASVALLTLGVTQAWAFDTANSTITMTTALPTATVTIPTPMNFGEWVVIQHATDTETLVLSNAGAIIPPADGGAGTARMILDDATAESELIFDLQDALPAVDMSFQIGDPGVAAGTFDDAIVTLAGPPSSGAFNVSAWTCAATGSDGETLTNYSAVTGIGDLLTGTDTGEGVAVISCGATLTTVAGANPFNTGAYTGDVRITVLY